MSLRELLAKMASLGVDHAEAKAIYRTTLGAIPEQIVQRGVADVPGVGSFSARVTHRPARQAVNPFTRQPLTIPGRTLVRILFSVDSALLEAIDAHYAKAPPVGSRGLLHDAFFAVLSKSGYVTLAGLGAFRVCKMPAQRARLHPRTGAVIAPALPAHRDVRFRAASQLKAKIVAALRGESVEE